MDSTALLDNRVKIFVVMLPALALAMWIASQIADEDYLVPWLIMGGITVALVFAVFLRSVRIEAVTLCFLITGYLIGNRGFADLTPFRPLFPGEMALAIIGVCLLMRFALTRELPDFSGWLARVILIYCCAGAARLALDYQTYNIDAIRDSAIVYYSAFFFFGRDLVARTESRALLEGCLRVSFLVLAPIALLERVAPDMLVSSTGGATLFYQKDDLLTTFAAAAAFIIYTRPQMYKPRWIRPLLIAFYLVFVVSGVGRASLLGLLFGSVLLLVANQKRFFVYPALGLLVGIGFVASYASGLADSQDSAPAIFIDKISSMVDVTGSTNYRSEYGEQKAMNNEFRRALWETFVEDTNKVSPVFGLGFGYDFVSHFEATFQRGGWEGLRSAHNFYVTLYGRMGVTGLLIFLIITGHVIAGGLRAALLVRANRYPLRDLGYWCAIWTILISSAVGVVLEGPVGAVVFWAFLGVAAQCNKYAEAAIAAENEPAALPLDELPELPARRPLAFGKVST